MKDKIRFIKLLFLLFLGKILHFRAIITVLRRDFIVVYVSVGFFTLLIRVKLYLRLFEIGLEPPGLIHFLLLEWYLVRVSPSRVVIIGFETEVSF